MADDIPESWLRLLADFEAFLIQSNMSPRTWDLRMQYMRRFARGRSDAPADVQTRDIVNFLGNRDWSPATRRVARAGVAAFFRWAKKFNYIAADPTEYLAPDHNVKSDSEPATRSQIEGALKTATKARDRLMVRMAADAGMSAMEIAQSRPRDLREVGGDYYLRVFGKGGTERDVYLLPDLAEDVKSTETEYVFPGKDNGHFAPATVSRYVSKTLPAGVSAGSLKLAYRTSGGNARTSRGWRQGEPFHSADGVGFLEHPDLADSQALQQQIRRISRDLDRDPAAAIGACKELLETIFKAVLDARGVDLASGPRFDTFPQLFAKVDAALDLRASSVPENAAASAGIQTAVSSLAQVVAGIGTVRNKIGTGHGHDASPAEPRHARLVFNATVALAEFITDSWRSTEA